MNEDVAAKFESYPEAAREKLSEIRQLIFDIASQTPAVGTIEETLKWGEPAYLTTETKSGSTIRIDWKTKKPDQVALYVICTTSLLHDFVDAFPGVFQTEGERALLFDLDRDLPIEELSECIRMALTHKLKT